MTIRFAAGTFDSPTSTGQQTITAGFGIAEPVAIVLFSSGVAVADGIQQQNRLSFGATDGVNQWTTYSAIRYDISDGPTGLITVGYDTTSVMRILNDTVLLAEASIVSFNADGTFTLDWTMVDASPLSVGFMVWAGVLAEVGEALVDGPGVSNVVPVSFQPQVAFASNVYAVNDGCIVFGWGYEPIYPPFGIDTAGLGQGVRSGLGDVHYQAIGQPLAWTQVGTLGFINGFITDFSATGFEIDTGGANISITDAPVGWLALGGADASTWQAYGNHLGNDAQFPSAGFYSLGGLVLHYGESIATDNFQTVSFGSFDATNRQWCLNAYGQEDTGNPEQAIMTRAFYDDRINAVQESETTLRGYQTVTQQAGTHAPSVTTTGNLVGNSVSDVLYFVTVEPQDFHHRVSLDGTKIK